MHFYVFRRVFYVVVLEILTILLFYKFYFLYYVRYTFIINKIYSIILF
jgi:hypothetical protein